jgi:integrase
MVGTPARHLTDVAAQLLAAKGFADVERRRLVRETEKAGPVADAIVTLLLNTGLRIDEMVTLTWRRVNPATTLGMDRRRWQRREAATIAAERRCAQGATRNPADTARRRWGRRLLRQAWAVHGARY